MAEEVHIRDLYNTLRTGERGVSFEVLIKSIYFLQHATFSVLDARDAFYSSTEEPTQRFLGYRDFQFTIIKIAKARHFALTSCVHEEATKPSTSNAAAAAVVQAKTHSSIASDTQMQIKLIKEIEQQETQEGFEDRFDSIRAQMLKVPVLEMLDIHSAPLRQCFEAYGTRRDIEGISEEVYTISLEGFIDFLNDHFAFGTFFTSEELWELLQTTRRSFPITYQSIDPPMDALDMFFPHFLELFARVATHFHITVLQREGAQLRKAIESSRLEFSIEVLLEQMKLKRHIRHDEEDDGYGRHHDQNQENANKDPLAAKNTSEENAKRLKSLLKDVASVLDEHDRNSFARQKISGSGRHFDTDSTTNSGGPKDTTFDPPCMALIQEIVTPPAALIPREILNKLETMITYQNMSQFDMALNVLHECESEYQELNDDKSMPPEVKLFFLLTQGSILESARKDLDALELYQEALCLSFQLPVQHPARSLAKSCIGCILFYTGELYLAKRCYEKALQERKHLNGLEHVDTATVLNNLACCKCSFREIQDASLLLRNASRIFMAQHGSAHPRTALVCRNLNTIKNFQNSVLEDSEHAFERGELGRIIPGSRFQINALIPNQEATQKKKKKASKSSKGKRK